MRPNTYCEDRQMPPSRRTEHVEIGVAKLRDHLLALALQAENEHRADAHQQQDYRGWLGRLNDERLHMARVPERSDVGEDLKICRL
jgi:hypothetical protein